MEKKNHYHFSDVTKNNTFPSVEQLAPPTHTEAISSECFYGSFTLFCTKGTVEINTCFILRDKERLDE